MDYSIFRTLKCFKSFCNYVFTGLSKYLYRYIIRYHIVFNKRPAEFILSFRSCRKTYFDLLETYLNEHLIKLDLLIKAHRSDEGLISVAEINAAPHRRLVNIGLLCPLHLCLRSFKKLSGVLVCIFHSKNSFR